MYPPLPYPRVFSRHWRSENGAVFQIVKNITIYATLFFTLYIN